MLPLPASVLAALGETWRIDEVNAFAYLAAFGGGLISFLSPCVLPLVPAYLSLVTGLDSATLEEGHRRHSARIAATTGLFVVGFGLVWVPFGLGASALGRTLVRNQETLTRLSGALMVAMALFLLGSLVVRAPWLYREARFHPRLGRFGAAAPVVAGAALAFGWTPCIGPVLASILGIAANQDRAWAGGTLLAAYTLGLGVPFLVTGLAFGRLQGALGFAKRHTAALVAGSATILLGFGVLLVFDQLSRLSSELLTFLDDAGPPFEWLVELG
ncbi:MAG TPA: cytochrome c biogenesis protein CcdA [Acidimicrobiia bacterium]|nr:cytochrome c biogenesis protein CcdA [Acidimicrobiia bacterium]